MTAMSATMTALVDRVEADALPAKHTSSHWQHYGAQTVIDRQGGEVRLRGAGFGTIAPRHALWRLLHVLERRSYRSVVRPLRHYPAVWAATRRLAHDVSVGLTFDVWKFTVIVALLLEHWAAHQLRPVTFAMIGDGYGFLGALIRRCVPHTKLYCIDLPKTLVFQARTHEMAEPRATTAVLSTQNTAEAEITFVAPDDLERIPDTIDCAINIASMQEMTAFSIASYFRFLRTRSTAQSRFYCSNRLRKELRGGEVVSFHEYPWLPNDEIFMDGPCPYYTRFFAPYTLPNGPRIGELRVPYINHFDGAHVHRLVRLAAQETL